MNFKSDTTMDKSSNQPLYEAAPSSRREIDTAHKSGTSHDYANRSRENSVFSSGNNVHDQLDSSSTSANGLDLLGPKVEMVYSLLTMLGSNDRLESSDTFLHMTQDKESNNLLRQSGCLSLLVQLIHNSQTDVTGKPSDEDLDVVSKASFALRNAVVNQTDERRKKREMRILPQLERLRAHVLRLRMRFTDANLSAQGAKYDKEVSTAVSLLMKLSFDEEDRHLTLELGGVQAIADALILDQSTYGSSLVNRLDQSIVDFRKNVGMALTNLTFGAAQSKQLLCNYPKFLETINKQLESDCDALRLVFASVLRNLSWKADKSSKTALRCSGAVSVLTRAAMRQDNQENTLKNTLSALWNLSAHCSENKRQICDEPGSLRFLAHLLRYDHQRDDGSPQRLAILENGGGILRYISSHIALREDCRSILRRCSLFETLLEHLKSSSLTIVSNACSTLWNLSANNVEDQRRLWQMGAADSLRHLVHSKHKMIALGSIATLKNLLAGKPNNAMAPGEDNSSSARSLPCSATSSPSCKTKSATAATPRATTVTPQMRCSLATPLKPILESPGNRNCKPAPLLFTPDVPSSTVTANHLLELYCDATPKPGDVARKSNANSTQNFQSGSLAVDPKNEQWRLDAAATRRFHASLRRRKEQSVTSAENTAQTETPVLPECSDDMLRSYSVEPASMIASPVRRGPCVVRFAEKPAVAAANAFHNSASTVQAAPNVAMDDCEYEAVKMYAVEGAPSSHASRFSSISDLRSLTTNDDHDAKKANDVLAALETTLEAEKFPGSGSQGGSKTATFGMPTPMMYSRHSSLQSLDSCDLHSVRSTVYSEYSQLPTGQQSPSDLPDSPTQTCPTKITTSNANSNFENKPMAIETAQNSVLQQRQPISTSSVLADFMFDQQPRIYNTEQSGVSRAYSTISSFSALTIDEETKVKPCRHPEPVSVQNGTPASPQFKVPYSIPVQNPEPKPQRESQQQDLSELIAFALPKPAGSNNMYKGKSVAITKPMMRPKNDDKLQPPTSVHRTSPSLNAVSRLLDPATQTTPPRSISVDFAASSPSRPTLAVTGCSSNAGVVEEEERSDIRVYATEPAPPVGCDLSDQLALLATSPKSRTPAQSEGVPLPPTPCSSSKQSTANQSPKMDRKGTDSQRKERTDVEECIYSALPKPRKGRPALKKPSVPVRNGSLLQNVPKCALTTSTSSNLMCTKSTNENIKDAASLQLQQSIVYNQQRVSDTSGSLSEDNYSRIDEEVSSDEAHHTAFDFNEISQCEIDSDESDHLHSRQLLISVSDLLIEAEDKGKTCEKWKHDGSAKQNHLPEVNLSTNSAGANRLPVRTTKTVELRLQMAENSKATSDKSRSCSPDASQFELARVGSARSSFKGVNPDQSGIAKMNSPTKNNSVVGPTPKPKPALPPKPQRASTKNLLPLPSTPPRPPPHRPSRDAANNGECQENLPKTTSPLKRDSSNSSTSRLPKLTGNKSCNPSATNVVTNCENNESTSKRVIITTTV